MNNLLVALLMFCSQHPSVYDKCVKETTRCALCMGDGNLAETELALCFTYEADGFDTFGNDGVDRWKSHITNPAYVKKCLK